MGGPAGHQVPRGLWFKGEQSRSRFVGGPLPMTTVRTLPLSFRRFRRLRRSEALRALVRETRLSPEQFVYPLFVTHGQGVRAEIASMPGQYHLSIDQLPREAEELKSLDIPAVLPFSLP